jgi:serine protease
MRITHLSRALLATAIGTSLFLLSTPQVVSGAMLPFAFEQPSNGGIEPVEIEVANINQLIVKVNQKAATGRERGDPAAAEAAFIQAKLSAFSAAAGTTLTYQRTLGSGAWVARIAQTVTASVAGEMAKNIRISDTSVLYAQPDYISRTQFTPTDPLYAQQWHYFAPAANSSSGINAPAAWDTTRGAGVTVAVIDTGYTNHADLLPNVLQGYDFVADAATSRDGDGRDADAHDPGDTAFAGQCGFFAVNGVLQPVTSSFHGTHVSGTIAALMNNGIGGVGIAADAKILPVRTLGQCGSGSVSDIADGIRWAAGGVIPATPANTTPAKVINISLGGLRACDAEYQSAITFAVAQGASVVVAAGNSNLNVSGFAPANCAGVVSVAALDRAGNRAGYSNFGAGITVAAPGGIASSVNDPNGVLSTLNIGPYLPSGDRYGFYQGTSMAAPHVAGVVALLNAAKPNITPAEVATALRNSVRPFAASSSCNTGICGAGMLDAGRAIASVQSTNPNMVINVGHTGAWYDPRTSGQGFDLEVLPTDSLFFGGWYTYSETGDGSQRWYALSGAYAAGTRSQQLTIYRNTGGSFATPPATTGVPVGQATLSFQSCAKATLSYHFNDGRPDGTIALDRLTPDVSCQIIQNGGQAASHSFSATGIHEGLTANWFNPATSGQGFEVEIMPTINQAFIQWYTYAPNAAGTDQQRWYSMLGPFQTGSRDMFNLPIYSNSGGQFNALPITAPVIVGRADVSFSSCTNATINYRFDDGRVGSVALTRLTGRTSPLCTP